MPNIKPTYTFIVLIMFYLLIPTLALSSDLPKGDCNDPQPNTDLRHCSFYRKNLSGKNLSGCNLEDKTLRNVYFIEANLTGAKLNRSRLKQCNFIGAKGIPEWIKKGLDEAGVYKQDILVKAIRNGFKELQGANLSKIVLSSIDLQQADLSLCRLDNIYFENSNLSGSNFSESYMHNINFKGANLSKCDFTNATLYYNHFHKSNLESANLNKTKILNSFFADINIVGIKGINPNVLKLISKNFLLMDGVAKPNSEEIKYYKNIKECGVSEKEYAGSVHTTPCEGISGGLKNNKLAIPINNNKELFSLLYFGYGDMGWQMTIAAIFSNEDFSRPKCFTNKLLRLCGSYTGVRDIRIHKLIKDEFLLEVQTSGGEGGQSWEGVSFWKFNNQCKAIQIFKDGAGYDYLDCGPCEKPCEGNKLDYTLSDDFILEINKFPCKYKSSKEAKTKPERIDLKPLIKNTKLDGNPE